MAEKRRALYVPLCKYERGASGGIQLAAGGERPAASGQKELSLREKEALIKQDRFDMISTLYGSMTVNRGRDGPEDVAGDYGAQ